MNTGKRNMLMGLAALLLILCLLAAVGVSFARYRADHSQSLYFTVRNPGRIYLGTIATGDEPGGVVFDYKTAGSWKTVDDSLRLNFTVANGTSAQDYSLENQRFSVELVGGLGVWDGTEVAEVTLRVHKAGYYEELQGTATRIGEGSPLHQTYGDGWVYSFRDPAGEEITWELEGNRFSQVEMTVVLAGSSLTQPSLLQPVITGYDN